jgi:H+/Cl- antiporter ClcA
MKCVLSGVTLGQYLSLKTLLSKILGLSTAIGCGLFVGKEGPFVHTSSIIANQLSKLKFFRKIKKASTTHILLRPHVDDVPARSDPI